MSVARLLPLLLLLGSEPDKGWYEAAKDDGITVYARDRDDSGVADMKAIGVIDGPPPEVWKAIRDYANYKTNMPYTEESRVVATEGGDKVIHFYSVVNAPLVDRRDYCLRIVDESDWRGGKGYLKTTWTASDKGPPEKEDPIRVKISDGYWLLEPRDDGAKTFATYYVHTDPGGSIPKFIVNKANGTAVPKVFQAIRKVVSAARDSAQAGKK